MRIYLFVLSALLVTACQTNGPKEEDLTARESAVLNSSFAAEAISGIYRVSQARYYDQTSNSDKYTDEGIDSYLPPDPQWMTSEYYVQLIPTPAKDSLRVVVYGEGKIGKLQRDTLAPIGITEFDGVNQRTDYTYSYWVWGSKQDPNQLHFSRRAFIDHTDLKVTLYLSRQLDSNGTPVGKPVLDVKSASSPITGKPTQKPYVNFSATRRSPGIFVNKQ